MRPAAKSLFKGVPKIVMLRSILRRPLVSKCVFTAISRTHHKTAQRQHDAPGNQTPESAGNTQKRST